MRTLAWIVIASNALGVYIITARELPPGLTEANVRLIAGAASVSATLLALRVAKVI